MLKDRLITIANALLPDSMRVQFREAAGETIDPDEDQWRRLSGDSLRDLTPMTQWRMQKIAHYLWEQNLIGNRLIELPVAYLLAEGVKLTVVDDDNQKTLDRFWKDPINEMNLKLTKKVREMAIFGEQCWPTFINDVDGTVRLGYLDPAAIETVVKDPDNREQAIGVVTTKNRKGVALRYRVVINGDEDVFTQRTQAIRQTFGDGEAFYFNINDLSSGTRGRSDLLAQADWLDAYDQFLYSEIERYDFLRAFIWDVTLTGSTPEEVKKRANEIAAPKPGSVRVHNDAEAWSAEAPDMKAVDSAAAATLIRDHILGGASMPAEWYGGGAGGRTSNAAVTEMSEPTFKIYSMRQRIWKHILESVGRYVLMKKLRAESDATIDWADAKNVVIAEFPELSTKDTTKYAAALQQVVVACVQAIINHLMSRTFAIKLIASTATRMGIDVDPAEELAAAEAEAEKQAAADVFTPPASAVQDAAAAGAQAAHGAAVAAAA